MYVALSILTDPIHVPSPVYGYQKKEMAKIYKRVERSLSPEDTFKLQEKILVVSHEDRKCIRLTTGNFSLNIEPVNFCEAGSHPLWCCGRDYSAVQNDRS